MKKVRIAALKARLSHYLRRVRAGETITVLDRNTPIAVLGPWKPAAEGPPPLRITRPRPGTVPWHKVPLGDPLPPEVVEEIMALFYEDRNSERYP